jgi:predicted small secreted protein
VQKIRGWIVPAKYKTKENGMKRFSLLMLVALFLIISTLGCNAARGAGKDLENAGQSIQKTVDHND